MLTIGRILFAVLFIASGATKLLDIPATAQAITAKVAMPSVLTTYTSQLEAAAEMPIAQILAIAAGGVELVCGLLIALNLGARFFAIILVLFVSVATFYFHNFWDLAGDERTNNMIHALKNLSLIGALLMIAGQGRRQKEAEGGYSDV